MIPISFKGFDEIIGFRVKKRMSVIALKGNAVDDNKGDIPDDDLKVKRTEMSFKTTCKKDLKIRIDSISQIMISTCIKDWNLNRILQSIR